MRQVFKGDNYSREETIRGNTVVNSGFGFGRPLGPGICVKYFLSFSQKKPVNCQNYFVNAKLASNDLCAE